ncbi:MAG: carbohydrate kinase [Planctomycetes bacterium]|nr:carbohydrate kinase [Planctomycetota bacterium]
MRPYTTVSVGELVWDILPDRRRLGGAPANVAWDLAQFGADALIVSGVGRDPLGEEILQTLSQRGLGTAGICRHAALPTGTVTATLDAAGAASYRIEENVAWDDVALSEAVLDRIGRADAVNFGSLSQRTRRGRETVHAVLDRLPDTAVKVFDINLRFPFVDRAILAAGFSRAHVVKLNHEEVSAVAGLFRCPDAADAVAAALFSYSATVRHVIVTMGAAGLAWYRPQGKLTRPAQPPTVLVDTIGAGDAVTAACILGLLESWPIPRIMDTAMTVAAFVCSQPGAMPRFPASVIQMFR